MISCFIFPMIFCFKVYDKIISGMRVSEDKYALHIGTNSDIQYVKVRINNLYLFWTIILLLGVGSKFWNSGELQETIL